MESRRRPRPSVLALKESKKVKGMVSLWENLDETSGSSRVALSVITNSPSKKRKRRDSFNISKDTGKPRSGPIKSSRRKSCSSSPLKRRKVSRKKEISILSPLRGETASMKPHPRSPRAMIEEQKEKVRLTKLREALKEVFTTEQTYWKNLLQMQSIFYYGSQSLLTPQQLKSIFGNASSLLQHSQDLLLALRDIDVIIADDDEPSLNVEELYCGARQIAAKMLELLPLSLDDYVGYCANYEAAHATILQCDTKDTKFHLFLRQTQKDQVLNLYDTLILPVQRLPRYQMLLAAIQKYFAPEKSSLAEDAEIYGLLDQAVQCVISMNVSVDKKLKELGNKKQMKEISSQFVSEHAKFFNPSKREFIKRGTLRGTVNDFYNTANEGQKRIPDSFAIFLFSDEVIVAYQDHKGSKFTIFCHFPVKHAFLLDTTEAMNENCFQMITTNNGFTFRTHNKSELIAWKSAFKNALNKATKLNPSILVHRNKITLEEDNDTKQWHAILQVKKYCTMRKPRRISTDIGALELEIQQENKSSNRSRRKQFSPRRLLSPRKREMRKHQTLGAIKKIAAQEKVRGEARVIPPLVATNSFSSKTIGDQRRKLSKTKKGIFSKSNPNLLDDDIIKQSSP